MLTHFEHDGRWDDFVVKPIYSLASNGEEAAGKL